MEDITNIDIVMISRFFNVWTLYAGDVVVKSVVIFNISIIYSWNVIVSKIIRMRQLKKLEKEFEEIFWSGNSFDLYETLNFNQTDLNLRYFVRQF